MVTDFFHSYLFGFCFWSNLALGAPLLLMIYHLTGGEWGQAIDEILVAATRTIFVVALLFTPLFLGVSKIYSWSDPGRILTPKLIQQSRYLNPTSFSMRTVFYFAAWCLLSYFLVRWSE